MTTPPLLQHGDESFTDPFGSGRIYGAEQEGSGGVAYVQQRDGEDFTTLQGLGRASRPGVSLLSRPVGTRRLAVEEVLQGACCCRLPAPMIWCALVAMSGRLPSLAVEVVPSRVVVVLQPRACNCLFAVRPRSGCHGEMAMVTS